MAIKIHTLQSALPPELSVGKNVTLQNSWIDLDDQCSVTIGRGTELRSATITVRNSARLEIGDGCILQGRFIVDADSVLIIGHGLTCNFPVRISASEGQRILIGNDCLFSNVEIWSSDMHSIFDIASDGKRINHGADVTLGNRVWAASNTTILKGTQVSRDSVIGAGAVTSGRFPPNAIISGVPGKVTREGVKWSRYLGLRHSPYEFDDEFSLGQFVAAARAFDHACVIELGMRHFDGWLKMDATNYYVFYYLCRSIFETKLIPGTPPKFESGGAIFSAELLFSIFMKGYTLSRERNHPCGSYAFLLSLAIGEIAQAELLYKKIKMQWPEIDKRLAASPWAGWRPTSAACTST